MQRHYAVHDVPALHKGCLVFQDKFVNQALESYGKYLGDPFVQTVKKTSRRILLDFFQRLALSAKE
jgi:hypothetical protein